MAARTGHLTVLRELAPYIWPAGRPDLRMRVVMALVALIIAKAITLMVPIAYKAVVDLLTDEATGKQITAIGLAASPVFLIVAYGVGRVLMVLFAQFRDVWFTVVAQHAVRELANRTFRHLHELSLALSSRAPHRRVEPGHRAGRHRRRHHRAHGGAQLHSDRGRAAHDLGPRRLLFRLDLCGGRAR